MAPYKNKSILNSRKQEKKWNLQYYDSSKPYSLGSIQRFRKYIGQANTPQFQRWEAKQYAYSLLRQVKHKFPRSRTHSLGIDNLWQADILDMQAYSSYNDKFRYILTVIDVFSKYAWVRPLLTKSAAEVSKNIRDIFQDNNNAPANFHTDQGKEFENANVRKLMNDYQVNFYTSVSDKKAAVVERFNRTIRMKLQMLARKKNTYRYLEDLQSVVKGYNSTPSRVTGLAPMNVGSQNEAQVYEKLYGPNYYKEKTKKPAYKVGDSVRLSSWKGIFDKEADSPNWTEEIFTIHRVLLRHPYTVYRVIDSQGEPIQGIYYEAELQKVAKPSVKTYFKIEKILSSKKVGKQMKYLVKWWGYPSKMNSWVTEKDIKNI